MPKARQRAWSAISGGSQHGNWGRQRELRCHLTFVRLATRYAHGRGRRGRRHINGSGIWWRASPIRRRRPALAAGHKPSWGRQRPGADLQVKGFWPGVPAQQDMRGTAGDGQEYKEQKTGNEQKPGKGAATERKPKRHRARRAMALPDHELFGFCRFQTFISRRPGLERFRVYDG